MHIINIDSNTSQNILEVVKKIIRLTREIMNNPDNPKYSDYGFSGTKPSFAEVFKKLSGGGEYYFHSSPQNLVFDNEAEATAFVIKWS